MDEINAIVRSESLSSHLPGCADANKSIVGKDRTKVFTHTKSRLFIHYNNDTNYNEKPKKLCSFRSYDQPSGSSAPTLRTFQQQLMLEPKTENEPREKLPSNQTGYNQPFDLEKFRRHSSREVSTSLFKQNIRTELGSDQPKNDFSMNTQVADKVTIQGNEDTTEICKTSKSVDTTSRKRPSFTQQNQEKAASPGRPNTVPKASICETEIELIRTRHDGDLANLSKDDQACVHESLILNNEHSNDSVDFNSMRQNLQNSSSPIKTFDLIQSMVLRLSNQEPEERLSTVQNIVDNDVLGVSGENGTNILEDLLWPINITTPHPLQTSAAKLLNVLVSFEVGRDYFNKMSMVKLLTWSSTEQINDLMADNLMSALKKLSLNTFQRNDMLEKGLLQWLIKHMEMVQCSASTVHMECMTDLLRVLLNVDNSAELAFVNVPHLIVVLVRYLGVANEYVQVNVGHVLRTLFSSDTAVAIGNKIKLHRIIRNLFEKASNSKLRADLRYIYELFVKHRTDNTELSAGDISRSTVSENTIRDINSEIDSQHEQLICEKNLTRKSEVMDEKDSNEEGMEQAKNVQPSAEVDQSVPPDLTPTNLQICVVESINEMDRKMFDNDQNDESATITKAGAEVLYSNLNSMLEQSSSLLSSGSQCASSECKKSAIQTLRNTQPIEMNQRSQKLATAPSPKLHLMEIYETATANVVTDYSDLSSIAKDRVARNDILENDSFIDELCEKVLKKLRSKLAANFFCGPNCNTDVSTNCCSTMKANVP